MTAAMTTVTAMALRRSMGAEGDGEDGGDGEHRRGPGRQAHLRQQVHRVQVVAVGPQHVAVERDRNGRGHQPGGEADRAGHDRLGGQHPAAAAGWPRTWCGSSRAGTSAVMNIVATTTTAISPASAPTRVWSRVWPGPAPPGSSGAMSPTRSP